MKKIAGILLLLITLNAFGQEQRYVLNALGTEIKDAPSWNAKTIKILQAGDSLVLLKDKISATKKSVFNDGLFLEGFWVQVNHNKTTGFVFDGNLTKIRPTIQKDEMYPSLYTLSIEGKLVKRSDSIRKGVANSEPFELIENYDFYENVLHKHDVFDGCFNEEYHSNTFTFAEMYHFMLQQNIDYSENADGSVDRNFPQFSKKEHNTYYFSGVGAVDTLQIEVKKNGEFVLSWYSCT
jgi:hypothetical protein